MFGDAPWMSPSPVTARCCSATTETGSSTGSSTRRNRSSLCLDAIAAVHRRTNGQSLALPLRAERPPADDDRLEQEVSTNKSTSRALKQKGTEANTTGAIQTSGF